MRSGILAILLLLSACGQAGSTDLASGIETSIGSDDTTVSDSKGQDVGLPDTTVSDVLSDAVVDDAGADSTPSDSAPDVAPDVAPDAATDVAADTGADVALECSAKPAPPGCACQDNSDCDSAACTLTSKGKECAKPCSDACPAGYACATLSASGSDVVNVCVQIGVFLCAPCESDKDCQTPGFEGLDHCLAQGSKGAFCGVSCDGDHPCPTGYDCANATTIAGDTVAQCVPSNNAECTRKPLFVKNGAQTKCENKNENGACSGTRHCTGAGLTPCQAPIPAVETCNGKDDNCNSVVDDIGSASCSVSNEFGSCPGSALCVGGNQICQGTSPTKEQCDGLDNNCNGETDEGFPDTDSDGKADCVDPDDDNDGTGDISDNCPLIANADQANHDNDPAGDACDTDDDNDGTPDVNDCDPLNPYVYPFAKELCDGVDNNCNKVVDEGTCDDSNLCTDDVCGATLGCSHNFNTTKCNDGNPCTGSDACDFGVCQGTFVACNDNNPCTDDVCDPVKGCVSTVNSIVCTDGNACTEGDACAGGACIGGKLAKCDDGNQCTIDTCDPVSGCKTTNSTAPCDDQNPCTVSDLCATGACSGTAKTCNDGNVCTTDSCDAGVAGGCVYTPSTGGTCNDGNACTTNDACAQGVCTGADAGCACGKDTDCAGFEDGDACNGTLMCDKSAVPYKCKVNPLTIVTCAIGSDQSPECASVACVAATGKCQVNTINEGNSCGTSNPCTTTGKCNAGLCTGGSATQNCDDLNACTTDSCDPKLGCQHAYNTGTCDDGNKCTLGDTCSGGSCTGGTTITCDDTNPCTSDACTPSTGCTHTAASGAPCNDNNKCTDSDICQNGTCVGGSTKTCSDNDPCTDTSCDPATGCVVNYNVASCTDNNACTLGDKCASGQCTSGAAKACNDGNACTTDACDAATGNCTYTDNTLACNDGNDCTVNDACSAGKCQGTGNPSCCVNDAGCDDGNACTKDICVIASGFCSHDQNALNGQACNADSNGCTQNDSCNAGTCSTGTAVDCTNAGDACNTATCQSTGVTSYLCAKVPKGAGFACDDGLYCTTADKCDAQGKCSGSALDCSAASGGCLAGTCDEVNDKCTGTPKADGTTCDADGSGCTQGDKCLSGSCTAGKAVDCQLGLDQCTLGSCKSTGTATYTCTTSAKPTGATCDDGLYCTTGETCDGNYSCAGGTARDCSASAGQCTIGACDEVLDKCKPTNAADNLACSDGDICTTGDKCTSGVCVGSSNLCGEHKVSTFKVANGSLRSPLVDTTLGRAAFFWRNGWDTISRWMSKDWSREATEYSTPSYPSNGTNSVVGIAASSFADGKSVVAYIKRDYVNNTNACYYYSGYSCANTEGSCYSSSSFSTYYAHYSGSASVDIAVQWYDKNGVASTLGHAINTTTLWTYSCTPGAQPTSYTDIRVAALPNGTVVVAYRTSAGVWTATLLSAAGAVVKATVATTTGDAGWDLTAFSDSRFAIARGTGKSVKVQVYNYDGSLNGSEVDVAPAYDATVNTVSNPAITTRAADDRIYLAWEVNKTGDTDIAARVFQSDLTPVQNAFVVNTTTTGMQVTPRIGVYPNTGGFLVVWEDQSGLDGSTYGIAGQVYSKTGVANGAEKVLNLVKTGAQRYPDAVGVSSGHVVVDWTGADGHVYSRKFDTLGQAVDDQKEAQINTTYTNDQSRPALASNADGTYIATWQSDGQDGSSLGVIGQRYDATGTKTGTEFVVNQTTADMQQNPSVASDSSGNFVVAWQGYNAADLSGLDAENIYFRLYGADGTALSSETIANSKTVDSQLQPDVARLPSGQFGVVWTTYNDAAGNKADVELRCFDSLGNAVSGKAEVFANTTKTDNQKNARIAATSATSSYYLVVWDSFAEDGSAPSSWGIRGQLFNANNCSPVDAQISINTAVAGDQQLADVAVNSNGDFLVVWQSSVASGNGFDIWARLIKFDSNTLKYVPQTEFKVNPFVLLEQSTPVVTALSDNGFLVSYRTLGEDEDKFAIKAQRLDAALALVPNDWIVNISTTGDQQNPAVAALPNGGYVILWDSPGQDGSGTGVIGRRFPNP